jgi:two-component system cell cycle sensor histidine kinase/response regulator CckA
VDKLHTILPDVPVVFMSGYSDDTVSLDGIVDERHAFLQKPFSVAQLGKTLHDLLRTTSSAVAAH